MAKKSPKTDDLRQDERAPVSGWQASLFTDAVLTLESEVVDTSAHGAGLIIPAPEAAVLPDMELTLSLDTGHKKLTRKAKVRWLQKPIAVCA
ncbi:PilZ domain-containing protein [methane-oxidizing endosymbiont of Gigantopelta aegis]|uniref:PilZ domain-containing protein n=1 Tax=methane-oxidizing endosymbiont of Gigantopelta aegis TaxID=2794938 RepID=UPI001FDA10C6|nr:PilZ domain-containing protein [methane-oxidizing endosymbiont of Gigantopelta aegis]